MYRHAGQEGEGRARNQIRNHAHLLLFKTNACHADVRNANLPREN